MLGYRRSIPERHQIKDTGAMTSSTTKTEDFRLLDMNEIDAVSGGVCVTEASVYDIKGKGELEIGWTDCDGMPGVKIPYAKWTPTKPR
jgi:hypothetical protein